MPPPPVVAGALASIAAPPHAHVPTHAPSTHAIPLPQAWPHVPQLFESVCVSLQNAVTPAAAAWQSAVPVGHDGKQTPFAQTSPDAHIGPQVPFVQTCPAPQV